MNVKWPLKDMAVGDVASIHGVAVGKAKNYIQRYMYVSGKKFVSQRRKDKAGAEFLVVLRLNDDGTEPAPTGTKHVMEADRG
jgi:hypothetical protein